jgi:two-component system NtrC family sensor kinase
MSSQVPPIASIDSAFEILAVLRPPDETARTIVNLACRLFDAASAELWLPSVEAGNSWRQAAIHPGEAESVGALDAVSIAPELDKPRWNRTDNDQTDCIVPLRKDSGASTVGALVMTKAHRHNELLTRFACQATISLENSLLFAYLQDAKREWESTFDGMLDGVCIENENGSVLRANTAFADMLKLPLPKVRGQRREELLQNLPYFERTIYSQPLTYTRPGVGGHSETFRFCPDGDVNIRRLIWQTTFLLKVEGNSVVRRLSIFRDITDASRLQEQLVQVEKLAVLGELVSGVAHELNNPLTTVLGYAQLLQSEPSLTPSMERKINQIHDEAARASRIVANLLAFARREEPTPHLLQLNDVVKGTLDLRSYQLVMQNTRLEAIYSPNLPNIRGDAHQLQQVLLNIIGNAHQAMQEWRGGGEIIFTTQAVETPQGPHVRLTVSDNGPGIKPEHLRRVFDPFFTTKPAGEGTGLGMSISQDIVVRHGGRMWVESEPGEGARFYLDFPVADASETANMGDISDVTRDENAVSAAPDDSEKSEGKLLSGTGQSPKSAEILVVDDEEPVVMLISEVLALDGHEVTAAYNGAEALALLQTREFDLILSDVRMPAVGGPTFFEILQTTRPDLLPRVVFVTGDTVSKSTQEFLRRAGRPMLPKPFDPERLRELVTTTLGENGV